VGRGGSFCPLVLVLVLLFFRWVGAQGGGKGSVPALQTGGRLGTLAFPLSVDVLFLESRWLLLIPAELVNMIAVRTKDGHVPRSLHIAFRSEMGNIALSSAGGGWTGCWLRTSAEHWTITAKRLVYVVDAAGFSATRSSEKSRRRLAAYNSKVTQIWKRGPITCCSYVGP